jgi:hypothetical protein
LLLYSANYLLSPISCVAIEEGLALSCEIDLAGS